MSETATSTRAFRPAYFWIAQVCSWAGTSLQAAIVPLWLFALTGSTQLALGGFVIDALSRAVFGPLLGGVVARLSARTALIVADAAGACVALFMAIVVTGPDRAPVVYVTVPVLSLVVLMNQIAFQSLVPQLVSAHRLSTVNGRYQAALSLLSVVTPAAGALAAGAIDWRWLVAANGLSFLLSLVLTMIALPRSLSAIVAGPAGGGHPLTHLVTNARRALSGTAGRFIMVEAALFAAFGGSQSLLFGFALERGQKEGSVTLAALLLASGVGMILGGLVLQKMGDAPRLNLMLVGVLSGLGPALVVVGGIAGALWVGVLGAGLIGASGNLLIGGITVVVQKSTTESDRPMALGFRKGISSLSQLLSYFWTLSLASVLGFTIVYPLAGVLACVAVFVGVALISRRAIDAG